MKYNLLSIIIMLALATIFGIVFRLILSHFTSDYVFLGSFLGGGFGWLVSYKLGYVPFRSN